MSEAILIVGAGGFGREVLDWLRRCKANVAGFIDDTVKTPDVNGMPVISTITDYVPAPEHRLLVAVGHPQKRAGLVSKLTAKGAKFTTMCADGIAAASASWGDGTIMCPFSVISAGARVGNHVHINICASVGHDVVLGDFCTLSSHTDICGNVTIGEKTFFGSGARVLPDVKIGASCIIGAGAIVLRDVPDGATMYAASARLL